MVTTTDNNGKLSLALKIVEILKSEYNIRRFSAFKDSDYIVKSLLLEFKTKYVFSSKEYKNSVRLYNKGLIHWQDLKSSSQKIFIEKMKECGNDDIDCFFGIKRERKGR